MASAVVGIMENIILLCFPAVNQMRKICEKEKMEVNKFETHLIIVLHLKKNWNLIA